MDNAINPSSPLFADLVKMAKSDLRTARREGSMLITGTVRGLLALDYDVAAKSYTLTVQGGAWAGEVLLNGDKAKVAAALIASLYTVEQG